MRVHRIRQIQGYLGDQEMTHKLVNEVAPALRRAQRRLHPHPEARRPPGRQRPDGAHRTGLTSLGARQLVVPSRPTSDPSRRVPSLAVATRG